MNRFVAFLFILSWFNCKTTFAQSTFYRVVGTPNGEEGHCVAECSDGGYFLSTSIDPAGTFNAGLVKTDCAGLLKWSYLYHSGSACFGYDIIPMPDSGCVFTYYSNSNPRSTTVVRLDKSGNVLWTSTFDLRGNYFHGSIVRDNDGNFYLCGNIIDSLSTNVTCLVKLNSSGQLCWSKKYNELYGNSSRCLRILGNNKLVIAGIKGFINFSFSDVYLMYCDTSGNQLARKLIGTPYDDEMIAMTTDNQENIYLTGRSYFMNSEWDLMCWKFDSQLNLIQCRYFDGATAQGENGRDLLFLEDQHLLFLGDEGGFNERNLLLLKTDLSGSPVWCQEYQVSNQFTNYLYAGIECKDGGILMTGDVRPASLYRSPPLMKTDASGNLGCFTSPFNISYRDESAVTLDSLASEQQIFINVDYTPSIKLPVQVQQHTFCDAAFPCANFTETIIDTTCNTACFDFTDSSSNANSWEWSFDGGNPANSFDRNPAGICFNSPGWHDVILLAKNNYGTDLYRHQVLVENNCPVIIPNVITPDGNNLNDSWKLTGISGNYSLKIFNRWGNMVFSSEIYSNDFRGKTNDGDKLSQGVYYYVLQAATGSKEYHGYVHILD